MVISEVITLTATSVFNIFLVLDNTYVDSYSILDIFVIFILWDTVLEFLFRLLRKGDGNGGGQTPGTGGGSSGYYGNSGGDGDY